MDFRKRLIAPCSTRKYGGNVKNTEIEVDFYPGEFLERLVLFDTYILDSIHLAEVPHLIRLFGYDQVMELLNSRIFQIHFDTYVAHGSTGRSSEVSPYRAKKGDLPYCSYCIHSFRIYPYDKPGMREDFLKDHKQFAHNNLQKLNFIEGVSVKQAKKLRKNVADVVVPFSSENISKEITEKSYSDYRNNDSAIKVGIASCLKETQNIEIDPHGIDLKIEFIDEEDFRVESNLQEITSLDIETIHKVVERGLLGIVSRNHLIAKMKDFNCLVGYRENEVPVFGSNLDFIVERAIYPKKLNTSFQQVLSIKGLPDFSIAASQGEIDLIELLKIRNSKECEDFRTWLWNQDSIDPKELKDHLDSFLYKFSNFAKTPFGKGLRWFISTGLGVAIGGVGVTAGVGASFGLSALDSFLLEHILPKSGAISFINDKLPTIYKKPDSDFYKLD